jgi:hypothetical protein
LSTSQADLSSGHARLSNFGATLTTGPDELNTPCDHQNHLIGIVSSFFKYPEIVPQYKFTSRKAGLDAHIQANIGCSHPIQSWVLCHQLD